MAILVDFSQIYLAPIFVDNAAKSCAQNPSKQSRDMMLHFVVNSIRATQMIHKKNYGNVVIACDEHSWRNEVFPQYKWARKQKRQFDDSGIDWAFVDETADYIKNALQKHFPYIVISVNRAEADDIIGSLVRHISSTTGDEENMFGEVESEKILINSSDKDNFQLHRYSIVKQWSPLTKKLVKPDIKPEHALIEKIVRGDISDGIPSIKCADDWFTIAAKERAPAITKKYLQTFLDSRNPVDECLSAQERINYLRNERLVSYEFTPKEIDAAIIDKYNSELEKLKTHSKMKLMTFLAENKMNILMSKISDFY